MANYSKESVLETAKRFNNIQRSFLFVNPLQAKHIPSVPSQSIKMMRTLGESVAKKYGPNSLVIGFAETATAIGAIVAECINCRCNYIQTTREKISEDEDILYFLEEHSHAKEQYIVTTEILLAINAADNIIFVDDEVTTGKTLINIINTLKDKIPVIKDKKLVIATILNRITDENRYKLRENDIREEYLVHISPDDVPNVEEIEVQEASFEDNVYEKEFKYKRLNNVGLLNPRMVVGIDKYIYTIKEMIREFMNEFPIINEKNEILVLGTEECMLPALLLGNEIEKGEPASVKCHSTTRSPIGISQKKYYPINSGCKISSFYDIERKTYLYEIDSYDIVIIVSDSLNNDLTAFRQLVSVFSKKDCKKFFYIQGGNNVWYI